MSTGHPLRGASTQLKMYINVALMKSTWHWIEINYGVGSVGLPARHFQIDPLAAAIWATQPLSQFYFRSAIRRSVLP